jgi:Uma2 family endonuclease
MSQLMTPMPPGRHRWKQHEFYQIAALGLFPPDAHLELIDGTILVNEESMNTPHATSVTLASDTLRERLPKGYHVRVQLPFVVNDENEPLPDVVLVEGSARDYLAQHPQTAAFILEVADTSVDYDQDFKAPLYAAAGVEEYGILNIPARQLEIYRKPQTDADGVSAYAEQTIYEENSVFSLRKLPEVNLTVAEILP